MPWARQGGGAPGPSSPPLPTDTLGAALETLELEVRPQTASGLVFHLGRVQAPPYLQLQVLEKQVLLRADDGAGEFSTWVTCPAALCDGQWHRLAGESAPSPTPAFPRSGVPGGPWGCSCGAPSPPHHMEPVPTVTRRGNMLQLKVDTQSNHTVGPAPAASADARPPLHLGGLPGERGLSLGVGAAPLSPHALEGAARGHWPLLQPVSPSSLVPPGPLNAQAGPLAYRGCMRNLVLNQSPVTWPRSVGVQGAVGASGCPSIHAAERPGAPAGHPLEGRPRQAGSHLSGSPAPFS